MEKEELRRLLNQPYKQTNWKKVIDFVFPNVAYPIYSQEIVTDSKIVESLMPLGTVRLNDGKNLALFEVRVVPEVNIPRNRVALRNIVDSLIDQDRNHGALVIYEQGKDDYRFTFTAKDTIFDEAAGDFVAKETDSKRFTYILGENESCKTPAQRFYSLAEKKSQATIEDVEEAFSVEKLSKQFFKEYKQHYELFVNYLVAHDGYRKTTFKGDEKAIRDFVKLLLGRLVFIQFVQKKRWLGIPANEPGWQGGDVNFLYHSFQQFQHKDLFYSTFLEPLFYEALNKVGRPDELFELTGTKIPYLNGGLFEKGEVDTSYINFPATYFESLLEFFNRYNFTIDENDPQEHEVGIDPEMLGHVFENLLEDNKDKGAFYTPKEIVHYMCQESLKEYLKTYLQEKQQWPAHEADEQQMEQSLQFFVKKKEAGGVIDLDESLATALRDVKICDPAIGSGAFPMGLLNEIFQCMYVLYHASPDIVGDVWGMNTWQPHVVKANIIQNSIYGVDIEKGAVDIARLRFWLSLIVDEPEPTALPNLDYKIVVGNSLVSKLGDDVIDIDWELSVQDQQTNIFGTGELHDQKFELLNKISREQKEFFSMEGDKSQLALDIRNLKIDLLITQLNLMVKSKGLEEKPVGKQKNITKQTELWLQTLGWKQQIGKLKRLKDKPEEPLHFFDWKLDFPEVLNPKLVKDNGGFDIVIGNPPYVQMQKNGGYLANELKNKNYRTFERTGDIYAIFYELGFVLLKQKGVHTFITSSQWMKANYGTTLRKLFLTRNPLKLIALGPGVFETAVVDTNILIAKNELFRNELKGGLIKNAKELERISDIEFCPMPYITESKWAILDGDKRSLSEKINRKGKPLKRWNLAIYRGVLTGFNEAFIIDSVKRDKLVKEDIKSKEIIKPILRGREIEKYLTKWDGGFIIATFPSLSLEISRYHAVQNYLQSFQPKLNQTGEAFINSDGKKEKTRKRTHNKWFETQDQIGYFKEYKKEKIIWKRIGSKLRFTFYKDEIYSLDSTAFATGEKIKYLTALLNSKLCSYLLFETAPKTGMGDLIISVQALEPLPVYYPKETEEKRIVELLDKILLAKSQSQDTTALEQQIDNLVYKLYELTYDEVLIIEPEFATRMSREEYEKLEIENG